MGEWACLKVRVETQLFLSPLQKSGFFGTQEVRWVLGVRVCVCVYVSVGWNSGTWRCVVGQGAGHDPSHPPDGGQHGCPSSAPWGGACREPDPVPTFQSWWSYGAQWESGVCLWGCEGWAECVLPGKGLQGHSASSLQVDSAKRVTEGGRPRCPFPGGGGTVCSSMPPTLLSGQGNGHPLHSWDTKARRGGDLSVVTHRINTGLSPLQAASMGSDHSLHLVQGEMPSERKKKPRQTEHGFSGHPAVSVSECVYVRVCVEVCVGVLRGIAESLL